MSLPHVVCTQLDASKKNEDCRIVPPRNEDCFTLAPLVTALGHKPAVIARHEAIFNCSFFHVYLQESSGALLAGRTARARGFKPTRTPHLSQGRY